MRVDRFQLDAEIARTRHERDVAVGEHLAALCDGHAKCAAVALRKLAELTARLDELSSGSPV